MNEDQPNIEEMFYDIYKKHVKRYSHSDTNQICCMWSTSNPPDEIVECDQIYDIEKAFDIVFSENDAMDIYDMDYGDAIIFIQKKVKENR